MAYSSKRSRPPSGSEGAGNRSNRAPEKRSGWEPETGVPRYIQFPAGDKGGWGPSVASVLAGFGLMMTAYLVAEGALASDPHGLHWLAAVAGGIVGAVTPIVAGRVFARSR